MVWLNHRRAAASTHPAAPVDPEISRLLKGLGELRAAATLASHRVAIDGLVAEVTSRLERQAQREAGRNGHA